MKAKFYTKDSTLIKELNCNNLSRLKDISEESSNHLNRKITELGIDSILEVRFIETKPKVFTIFSVITKQLLEKIKDKKPKRKAKKAA